MYEGSNEKTLKFVRCFSKANHRSALESAEGAFPDFQFFVPSHSSCPCGPSFFLMGQAAFLINRATEFQDNQT
jgi:hypothetical protein